MNNAGVGIRDSVADVEMSACRELFETNFFGMIHGMQAVIPLMKEQGGGTIINISSIVGHIPMAFSAPYSASKFAMNALGKGARVELQRDNINVLTVCPGYVRTDFGEHVVANRSWNVRPPSVRGVTAARVARATYDGYCKRKREVIVPWTMIPVIKLYQTLPGLVEWGMARAIGRAKSD